ncbi:ABC-2 family transporter protein [Mycoplasmatota bacterium WC44]
MEVKKNILLIFTCIKYNLLKEMEYRFAFIFQIVGMILNNGTFIVQWMILFTLKSDFEGYVFQDILILWAVAAGSFGLNKMVFMNANNISNYIVTGKLDTYLVQPKNVLINVISSRMSTSSIGDIAYGFLVLIVLRVSLKVFLLYLVLIFLGAIIHAAFNVITHSLSFWLGRAESIANSLEQAILMPSTYPEGIFKGLVRGFMFSIIPVGFIVFIPVRLLDAFDLNLFILLVLFTIIVVTLAFVIFNKGLKKYSSSNLMIVRM